MTSDRTLQAEEARDAFRRTLFLFAKEFGWGPEYIAQMPFKLFRIYASEMADYYREQKAASEGKKYTRKSSRPLSQEDKERRSKMIDGWVGNDNGNKQSPK